MIRPDQVIRVSITDFELRYCEKQAIRACLGGKSGVRDRADRKANLNPDQLHGMLGNIALSKYLTGSSREFMVSRWNANMHPSEGDGGSDLPGLYVDVKASLMRRSQDPLRYRLRVPPDERHPGGCYVLALIGYHKDTVYLVGWLPEEELTRNLVDGGPWHGMYIAFPDELYPLMPMKWWKITRRDDRKRRR